MFIKNIFCNFAKDNINNLFYMNNNIDYNELRLAFKLLKENGIYHQWKRNLLLLNNQSTLLRRLEHTKGNDFLPGSFCWSMTREGHIYWEMWHKYFYETAN